MSSPSHRLQLAIGARVIAARLSEHQKWLSIGLCREFVQHKENWSDVDMAIKAVSNGSDSSDLVEFVRHKMPQAFMLLLYLDKAMLLRNFYDNGITDEMFPLKLIDFKDGTCRFRTGVNPPIEFDLAIDLKDADIETSQRFFFAHKLCWTSFDAQPLDTRLEKPFIAPMTEMDKNVGGFSILYHTVVHRDHIALDSTYHKVAKDPNGHPLVAIKRLLPTAMDKTAFESFAKAEHEVLDMLRDLETAQHLIRAVAFYKTEENSLYFVFPWAQHGNLRQFWKERDLHGRKVIDTIDVKWAFEQISGLADAIQALHYQQGEKNCRHGDLKPENVLCFESSGREVVQDHTSCDFVITDVGVSRTYDLSTKLRAKSVMAKGHTVAYAAPETELFPNQATSRRYDIWSFGCLCLEFVTWLLLGNAELEKFTARVHEKFYILKDADQLHPDKLRVAEVHPEVNTQIEKLRKDPRCGVTSSEETAIGKLIHLVEKRLLVVTATPDPKAKAPPQGEDKPDVQGENTTWPPVAKDARPKMNLIPPTVQRGSEADDMAAGQETGLERKEEVLESERAYADEVYKKIRGIVTMVEDEAIRWIHPSQATGTSLSRNQYDVNTESEYIPDENAAKGLRATLDQLRRPTEPSQLYGRCEEMSHQSLWKKGFEFSDTVRNLNKTRDACDLCLLLSRSVKRPNRDILADERLVLFRLGSSLYCNSKTLGPIASLYTMTDRKGPTSPETLTSDVQIGFPKQPDPGSPTHCDVLREWIRDCSTHPCVESQDAPFLPTRLLFVGKTGVAQPRLLRDTTQISKDEKYVALSHRWGKRPEEGQKDPLEGKIVCTYAKNIDALEQGIDESKLPPMYQDAIAIARQLDVKYLWIDSLCIIQRDREAGETESEDWKTESKQMEDVFRAAYLTVAATCAGSPAEHFLKPRQKRQCVTMQARDSQYYLCDFIDNFSGDVEDSELNKRGWVLQERALSRRTIYFAEKQTYWECGQGVRCETLAKLRTTQSSLLGDAHFPNSFPDYVGGDKGIKFYQDLFERYSRLQLSEPTDRPVAAAGLETRLLRVLGTKGRFGVFECYLRQGLLWRWDDGSVEDIDFSECKWHESDPVPTWSWMAYTGTIRYMVNTSANMEWAQWERDVVSPWNRPEEGGGGDDGVTRLELQVLVRDLGPVEPRSPVFRDNPSRSIGPLDKCVIIGSEAASSEVRGPKYYVMLVAPLDDVGEHVYRRVGVAILRKHNIVLDKEGIKARVR